MNAYSQSNTLLRKFALERLNASTHRRHERVREIAYLKGKGVLTGDEVATSESLLKLMDRVIYSLYLDCVDAGADAEARRLLDDLRNAEQRPVCVAR